MADTYIHWTDRARKVMQLASQEAQRFYHEYIGTEHILLGLVKEGSGVAANVLKNLDIDLRKIRLEVEKIVQAGPGTIVMGKLPQTPRAKKVIEYSLEEMRHLNHTYTGTEHLLLGLLREQEAVAAQVLMNLGLRLEDVRQEVLNLLGPGIGLRFPMPLPLIDEAQDLPAAVRCLVDELDTRIAQFDAEKEAAIAEQDFEKAAHLRDQADKLNRRKRTVYRDWAVGHLPEASWLSWHEGTVAKLVRVISAEQRWKDLPILADALEEAGCTDPEILSHCRQEGGHVTHCWVVDLLLAEL